MDAVDVIDKYCEAWSECDPGVRANLLCAVFETDATYTDPNVHLTSREALLSHISKVQIARPCITVLRTTGVDAHHAVCRFAWCLVDGAGHRHLEGVDFVELNGSSIKRVVVFFGALMTP